jgi:hypothetical protein
MARARRRRQNRRGRRRRGKGRGGLGIRKDLNQATKLADKFNLIPELGTLDATRSPEIAALLADRQSFRDQAGVRSQEQIDALAQRNQAISGLEAGLGGLTAQENTLFRERGAQGLDQSFATGLRQLAVGRGASGVRGAASQAGALQLGQQRGQAQIGLERDLQLENIAVQDRRRSAFLDALTGRDEQLNLLENREFDRQRGALTDLERSTQLARLDELQREQFNIGQSTAEQAARQATLFGLVGLRGNRRAQDQAFDLQQQQINNTASANAAQANAIAGLNGGGGGSDEVAI